MPSNWFLKAYTSSHRLSEIQFYSACLATTITGFSAPISGYRADPHLTVAPISSYRHWEAGISVLLSAIFGYRNALGNGTPADNWGLPVIVFAFKILVQFVTKGVNLATAFTTASILSTWNPKYESRQHTKLIIYPTFIFVYGTCKCYLTVVIIFRAFEPRSWE